MKCLNSATGVALSCGIVLASLASAQTKKSDPPTITVCDLFRDLPAHAGEMISVRGLLYQGREVSALGELCDSKFVTKYTWAPVLKGLPEMPPTGEFVWPTALDLTSASFVGEGESPVDFETDEAAVHKVFATVSNQRAKLNLAPGQQPEIRVTVIGRLRVKAHHEIVKRGDGTPMGGYGHLSAYPAQIVLKTMYDPVVQPK
jgi:hypothetical protein